MNLYLIEWDDVTLFNKYPNECYMLSYKQLKLGDISIIELEEIKKYRHINKGNNFYMYDISFDWSNSLLISNAICMIKKAERDKKINILL